MRFWHLAWMIDCMLIESVSIAALIVVLVCAVIRPFLWPEAVFTVPCAALVAGCGAIPFDRVLDEAERLGPVIAFLAAVLVLAKLCDDEGLFRACGVWMARWAHRRPRRLLGAVFALASMITAVLSLDATVVLLTPVVCATTTRMDVRAKPHVYASAHLSNTASLLLPVSNLTNLLAFSASGLTFTRFALLMLSPWLVAIAVEYAAFRRFFTADLDAPTGHAEAVEPSEMPLFALVTVAATLAGFAVASTTGIDPAWVAMGGAVVMAARALGRRHTTLNAIICSTALPFLAFVLALGIVVRAVIDNGLGTALGRVLPDGASLPALFGIAALAAVLANLVNNLPAVLALAPLASSSGPGGVLAVLLGVNIGPNLTYVGSLATLLWRRIVYAHGHKVELKEFTLLGLLTVPTALALATLALWISLQLIGT